MMIKEEPKPPQPQNGIPCLAWRISQFVGSGGYRAAVSLSIDLKDVATLEAAEGRKRVVPLQLRSCPSPPFPRGRSGHDAPKSMWKTRAQSLPCPSPS
jgi:hypothetical protein